MKALGYCLTLIFMMTVAGGMTNSVFAQKATAERIAQITPPQSVLEYKDGARQVTLSGDLLFITNFWAGLKVVDISDIRNPKQLAVFPSEDESYATFVRDNRAYVANHSSGVIIYDYSDVTNIRRIAGIKLPGNAYDAFVEGQQLYAAMGDSGFAIVDIADVTAPVIRHIRTPGKWIQQTTVQDGKLYAAAKNNGLLIFDLSGSEPQQIGQLRTNFNTMMVQVESPYVYMAEGPGGLTIADISTPESPVIVSQFGKGGFVGSIHKSGSYVYLANRNSGLRIVNVNDLAKPFLEGQFSTEGISYGVYKRDVYVFLAANNHTEILRHNNSPRLADLTDMQLKENELFTIQLDATEPDGDAFVYQAFNLPEGATFDDQTGTFLWTPTFEQSGTYNDLVFRIVEQTESELSASDTIALNVAHVNRNPDLPRPPDAGIAENQLLTFTLEAGSDPDVEDQQRLNYYAENLPEGATFDPATRAFSWTPTYEQSGSYVVDFLMEDGAGGIDRETTTLQVQHVDRPPVLDAIAAQSIPENEMLVVQVSGNEPDSEDQNAVAFRAENLPAGAAFDPATRTFSWTPTFDQSGNYADIRMIMTAGNLSDTTSFDIVVTHVNRTPVLDQIMAQQVDENQSLTFSISGSDPDVEDDGKLTLSAENLPVGATFDPATRTFSWTPTFEQSGSYDVRFAVTDPSGLVSDQQVAVTVNHVNRAPVIVEAAAQQIDENQPLQFSLSASDPDTEDSGKLVFSAISLPEGATLDATSGAFSWTPTFDQSGEYPVTFVVSDGEYSDSTSTVIQVKHVNRVPELAAISAQQVDENQTLTFTVTASDPDTEDAGKLKLSANSLPVGSTFDDATGTFTWLPTFEQSGEYSITFSVIDPAGLSAQQVAAVTVNHVNRMPALAAVAAATVDENQPLGIALSGSDPDTEDAGKLVYSIANLPAGAQLDAATGQFNWTPSFEQSGSYALTAVVSDPAGASAEQPVNITVNHVNRAPEFAAVSSASGDENQPLNVTFSASDPDAEDAGKLRYSAENLPAGAVLNPENGALSWTPTFEQSGEYSITISVNDPVGASDSETATISIRHVNRPPVLAEPAAQTATEDESWSTQLPEASDPDTEDAGKLAYSMSNLPAGASFDAASRTVSWKPDFNQSGSHSLTYAVSDGSAEVTVNVAVMVENVNRPPSLNASGEQQITEGESLQFRLEGNDPDSEDNGKLQYSAATMPPGANLDANSGEFSWTPGDDQQGTYRIDFVVKDAAGLQASQTVTIVVVDKPAPPAPPQSGNE